MIHSATVRRILDLTKTDLQYKSVAQIFLSASEESGEFARELKVEEGVFGNDHKKPDKDGTKGESVDCIIMWICLYLARGGTPDGLDEHINRKLDKWAETQQLSLSRIAEIRNE